MEVETLKINSCTFWLLLIDKMINTADTHFFTVCFYSITEILRLHKVKIQV